MSREKYDKPYRSASQLKLFTDCGEAFRIRKVEKLPGKPAAWTVRGIAVHDTIEAWEKSSRTIDPVAYLQDVAWSSAYEKLTTDYPDLDNWLRTPGTKNTANDLKLREKESPTHVYTYCERAVREENDWRVTTIQGMPCVEVEFKIEFPTVTLVGHIDQIIEWWDGETYTIKDIKSGRDTHEDNRQLGLYAYAANKLFKLGIDTGTYWYTKLDKDTGMKDLSIYTYSKLQREYAMLNRGIEEEIFLPNPDVKKCEQFCGVREYCREWNK